MHESASRRNQLRLAPLFICLHRNPRESTHFHTPPQSLTGFWGFEWDFRAARGIYSGGFGEGGSTGFPVFSSDCANWILVLASVR